MQSLILQFPVSLIGARNFHKSVKQRKDIYICINFVLSDIAKYRGFKRRYAKPNGEFATVALRLS